MDKATLSVSLSRLCIEADVHKMDQVLRNLLSNAVKFSPKGGSVLVKLEVTSARNMLESASSRVAPTSFSTRNKKFEYNLRIDVVDSGVGISKVREGVAGG